MDVYDLSDIVNIVKIEEARAKNWTVGRPLRITPSVRQPRGPGSRALYSVEDLYLVALLDELWRAGLTAKALGRILDALPDIRDVFNTPNASLLVLHMRGKETGMELIKEGRNPSFNTRKRRDLPVHHVINLTALKAKVNAGIVKAEKGRK